MRLSIKRTVTLLLMAGALAFTAVGADARGGGGGGGGGGAFTGGGGGHGGGFGGGFHEGGGFHGGGFQANTNHFDHDHRFRDRGFGGYDYGDYCDPSYPTSNARYCQYPC